VEIPKLVHFEWEEGNSKNKKKKELRKKKKEEQRVADEKDPEIIAEKFCDDTFPLVTKIRRLLRTVLKNSNEWPVSKGFIENFYRHQLENTGKPPKQLRDQLLENLTYIVDKIQSCFLKGIGKEPYPGALKFELVELTKNIWNARCAICHHKSELATKDEEAD
jgi:hypothetical protein